MYKDKLNMSSFYTLSKSRHNIYILLNIMLLTKCINAINIFTHNGIVIQNRICNNETRQKVHVFHVRIESTYIGCAKKKYTNFLSKKAKIYFRRLYSNLELQTTTCCIMLM